MELGQMKFVRILVGYWTAALLRHLICSVYIDRMNGLKPLAGNSKPPSAYVSDKKKSMQPKLRVLADSPSPQPSSQPSAQPSSQPSLQPSSQPSVPPTIADTIASTALPSVIPTYWPSTAPTTAPSVLPTAKSTAEPTAGPTRQPTAEPTIEPSAGPTRQPTAEPTIEPSPTPSVTPTVLPTAIATLPPSDAPTAVPTTVITAAPSVSPSATPVSEPTSALTDTLLPTIRPSPAPGEPTIVPTLAPTVLPSTPPTAYPTAMPTQEPSLQPSLSPSELTKPVLLFAINVTLANISSDNALSGAMTEIVQNVTATVMGLSLDRIQAARQLQLAQSVINASIVYTLLFEYDVVVLLQETEFGSIDDLYTDLTQSLQNAADGTQFVYTLRNNAAALGVELSEDVSLEAVAASEANSISASTDSSSSSGSGSSGDDGSEGGISALAWIIAVAVVGGALLCFCALLVPYVRREARLDSLRIRAYNYKIDRYDRNFDT